ncbi:hypothetical protein [Actinomadura sp. SCN-SB]|uniref:hypothetical protein n=1 Tax=Actinomadura sp. SCN-SB TaxID=3373092 RepID=UPI0037529A17
MTAHYDGNPQLYPEVWWMAQASGLTPTVHGRDHELIAEAIAVGWLAAEKLLVHMAREHGFTVPDVTNAGLALLIFWHDQAHGGMHCFAAAEQASPSDGLREGLAEYRNPS